MLYSKYQGDIIDIAPTRCQSIISHFDKTEMLLLLSHVIVA